MIYFRQVSHSLYHRYEEFKPKQNIKLYFHYFTFYKANNIIIISTFLWFIWILSNPSEKSNDMMNKDKYSTLQKLIIQRTKFHKQLITSNLIYLILLFQCSTSFWIKIYNVASLSMDEWIHLWILFTQNFKINKVSLFFLKNSPLPKLLILNVLTQSFIISANFLIWC